MKKLIKSYRIFTSDLYRYLVVGLGTVILAVIGVVASFLLGPVFGIMCVMGIFLFMDMGCDFFVFQGNLDKKFDYGILKNSLGGFDTLKRGLIGDMLRRFLQLSLVTGIYGLASVKRIVADGMFEDGFKYAGYLLVMVLTVYTLTTFCLNLTRRHINYQEGILAYTLCMLSTSASLVGIMQIYTNGSGVSTIPWIMTMGILALLASYIIYERTILRFLDTYGERQPGRYGSDEKKKAWIFAAVAFGIDFLMLPAMYIGYRQGGDLSIFLVAQMMYPAWGVVFGKLFSYNEGKLPVAAYVTVFLTGAVTLILATLSVTFPMTTSMAGVDMDVYYLISNYILILASILFTIFMCVTGREKRINAGFQFPNAGKTMLYVLLFVVLYFARVFILYLYDALTTGDASELVSEFVRMFASGESLIAWITVLINLPLTFIMFFGEEYGWRYYLQPRLQKRFGNLPGVLILGVLWGIWHAGADFMYYADNSGPQMLINQVVTCISFGIFFGLVYMKTKNIWSVVILHFLNNNMIMILKGDFSTEALQGGELSWSLLPMQIVAMAVFWLFAFAPSYIRRTKQSSLTEA